MEENNFITDLIEKSIKFPETNWFIGCARKTTLVNKKRILTRRLNAYKINFKQKDLCVEIENGSRIYFFDLSFNNYAHRVGFVDITGGVILETEIVSINAFQVMNSRIGRKSNERYGIIPNIQLF